MCPPAQRAQAAPSVFRRLATDARVRACQTRLKVLLKKRLQQAGWHDEMSDYCREVIRNKSLEHLDINELVQEIAPRSRAAVPDNIREDIAKRIQRLLNEPDK